MSESREAWTLPSSSKRCGLFVITVAGIQCVLLSHPRSLYLLHGYFLCMIFNLNIFCVLLTFSKNELEHVEIRNLDQLMGNTPEVVSDFDYEILSKRFE